jgi:hypothetical protein
MREIELEIGELVGYGLGGPDGNQVRKLGSTKLGCKFEDIKGEDGLVKMSTTIPDEPVEEAEQVNASA